MPVAVTEDVEDVEDGWEVGFTVEVEIVDDIWVLFPTVDDALDDDWLPIGDGVVDDNWLVLTPVTVVVITVWALFTVEELNDDWPPVFPPLVKVVFSSSESVADIALVPPSPDSEDDDSPSPPSPESAGDWTFLPTIAVGGAATTMPCFFQTL